MFDVIVLGGGPAGVTAALRARELGATVALVEKKRMGGTCTNDGCVPTRVLAKAARLIRDAEQFNLYGLSGPQPQVDFRAILARSQQVVYTMQEKKQLLDHLRDVKITVYSETGNTYFVDPHTIEMENGDQIQGDNIIICVGGHARRLSFPGAEYALTHSDVWRLDHLPESVVIVGGGATGCQLASVLDAFGSQVTMMDIAPRILLTEDADVAEFMEQQFVDTGIDMITGISGLERIERFDKGLQIIYSTDDGEQILDTDAVILSVGWPGNLENLGLESAGVETERGYIKVDDALRTNVPHIYAAGDITGKMMLVQSAGSQARIAAENVVMGKAESVYHKLVPHGGFTDPEYAGVGLTEAQAQEQMDVIVAKVPYTDLDRAVIDGRTVGFCKLIVNREDGLVVGAHVVGEQAVEVVQIVSAGMAGMLTVDKFADLELAYPTFAAIVGLAARQIVRELDLVPVAPAWRALVRTRASEWERLDH